MTNKDQLKDDILRWKARITAAKEEIAELKKNKQLNSNQIARLNAEIYNYNKIIKNKTWELMK